MSSSQAPNVGAILDALEKARVQFVVVTGDPPGTPLRLVVSRHPASLDALGSALTGLQAVLEAVGASEAGPHHPVDPSGTVRVATMHGPVVLLFGGPDRSLYSEVVEAGAEGEVAGAHVRVVDAPVVPVHGGEAGETPGAALGRRVLRMVDHLEETISHECEGPGDGPAD